VKVKWESRMQRERFSPGLSGSKTYLGVNILDTIGNKDLHHAY